MNKPSLLALGLALAAGAAMPDARAQMRDPIQPEAVQALDAVGARLRGLQAYTLDATVETRAALGAGRYRDFSGTSHYLVRQPDRLSGTIDGAGTHRQVFYDGRTLTVYAPALGKYARVDAPGTLGTALEQVRVQRGLDLPLAEVFAWGAAGLPMAGATRARYEGKGIVNGRACQQYSYMREGVSWDVSVDDAGLPCKLVMVDTRDRGLPGYSAELRWDTAARPAETDFAFAPPAGSTEVPLASLPESDTATR